MEKYRANAALNDMKTAVSSFAKERQLVVEKCTASYTANDLRFTIVLREPTAPPRTEVLHTHLASMYGLEKVPVGTEFMYGNAAYIYEGIRQGARKRPFAIRRVSDGKWFSAGADIAQHIKAGALPREQ